MSDYPARIALLEAELEEARERIKLLEQTLGAAAPTPMSFCLTGAEARVFGVILSRPMATKEMIMTALYADRQHDDEIAEPKIADVFVCKMRAKLKPFGVEIKTVWGQGWVMSAENKAKVQDILAQEDAEAEPATTLPMAETKVPSETRRVAAADLGKRPPAF